MTREHSPRPGTRWETTLRPVERVVDDDQPDPRPSRAARRATSTPPTTPCRVVDIDGLPIVLAGTTRDPTPQDLAALAELVHAVERLVAAETPEQREAREQRQAAGHRRIRERLDRLPRRGAR